MIKSLRKRHLRIWQLMAVALPLGILGAWLAVPKPLLQPLLQNQAADVLPRVLKSINKENCRVSIRSNADTTKLQLEWINKTASTSPSSLIYRISGSSNELIGRVEARGSYYFPLSTDSMDVSSSPQFIIYDIIHKQAIDTIKW
jgi:hypothetical protein